MWIDLRSQWEQTPVACNSIAGVVSAILLAGTGDLAFPDIPVSIDAVSIQGTGAITLADIVGPVDAAAPQFFATADLSGAISAILLQGDGALSIADITGPLNAARLLGDGALFSADLVGPVSAFNIVNLVTTTDFTWADISGVISATAVQGDGAVNFADLMGPLSASRLQADGALFSADTLGPLSAVQLNSLVQIEGSVADITVSIDGVLLEAGTQASLTLGPLGPMSASIGFVEPKRKKKRYPEPTPEVIEAPVRVEQPTAVIADALPAEVLSQLVELKAALKETRADVQQAVKAQDDEAIAVALLWML